MRPKKQQSKMYLRPVSQFNKGKQSEFNERKWFTEAKLKGGCPCEATKEN